MAKKTSTDNTAATKAAEALDNLEKEPTPTPYIEGIDRNFTMEGKKDAQLPGEAQPHLLPKWQRMDPTFFPGCDIGLANVKAFDRKADVMRPIGLPHEYVYQWGSSDTGLVARERVSGWRFCKYDGGSNSGLAPGGFDGTDLFERTVDNRVMNGDTYLMYIDRRKAEALEKEHRDEQAKHEAKPVNDFMNEAYESGIRGFTEDEWGKKTDFDPKKPIKHVFN